MWCSFSVATRLSHDRRQRFADAVEAQVFETSAKLGTNVDVAVLALMREVLHHRQFAVPEKTRSDEKGVRFVTAVPRLIRT